MTTYYSDGITIVAVVTGQPEQAVQVGMGETPREALSSAESTPIQSAGRMGEATRKALAWFSSREDLGSDLVEIEVGDKDMDDRARAWA